MAMNYRAIQIGLLLPLDETRLDNGMCLQNITFYEFIYFSRMKMA